jgi:hypothetical protein
MTLIREDLKRIDKRIKAKEFFTIELDHSSQSLCLYVNGELRNTIKTPNAESLFEKMLKIAKLKFIKIRNEIQN